MVAALALTIGACGGDDADDAATSGTDATSSAGDASSTTESTTTSIAPTPTVMLTEAMCPTLDEVNALQVTPTPYGYTDASVSGDDGSLHCTYQLQRLNSSNTNVSIFVWLSESASEAERFASNLQSYESDGQAEAGLTRADAASSGVGGYRLLRVAVGSMRVQIDSQKSSDIGVDKLRALYETVIAKLP
jgi:hypothetical protein